MFPWREDRQVTWSHGSPSGPPPSTISQTPRLGQNNQPGKYRINISCKISFYHGNKTYENEFYSLIHMKIEKIQNKITKYGIYVTNLYYFCSFIIKRKYLKINFTLSFIWRYIEKMQNKITKYGIYVTNFYCFCSFYHEIKIFEN